MDTLVAVDVPGCTCREVREDPVRQGDVDVVALSFTRT